MLTDQGQAKAKEELRENGYNGWNVLAINLCLTIVGAGLAGGGGAIVGDETGAGVAMLVIGGICIFITLFTWKGFFVVGINECAIVELCSKYKGTCYETGYRWLPFYYEERNFSLKVKNFETSKITCNDASGNPVQMEVVIVYQVRDAGSACYNVQNLDAFVQTSSEAAVRTVCGMYPYEAVKEGSFTLRGNSNHISQLLTTEIQKQCGRIGVMIIESRISYLAYSPTVAATMLRR